MSFFTRSPALNLIQPVNWANSLNQGLQAWWMVLPNLHGANVIVDITKLAGGVDYSVAGSGSAWPTLVRTNRPGGFGGAYSFDSSSSQLILTTLTTQFADFSCCVWFKAGPQGAQYRRIVDKRYNQGFWMGRQADLTDTWGAGCRQASAPYAIYVTLPDDEWNHLACTRKGTDWTVYGNGGAVINTSTVSATALSINPLRFGANHQENEFFSGESDDVRLWNRAIDATEVKQLYLDSRGR
jgi:hypothetical protein